MKYSIRLLLVMGALLTWSMPAAYGDYYNYWAWNTGLPDAYGIDGWVGGDGISRIIFYAGQTAYIYQVTTIPGPDGDNPNLHPANPDATGAIAPRVFTLESSFPLASFNYSHECEFHVGSDGIYLGAKNGIEKYAFDGTFLGNLGAPPPPMEGGYSTQSLAYDAANNDWWAGSIGFDGWVEMYRYDADISGSPWQLMFSYANPGGHHDGLDMLPNGNLLTASYTGHILEFMQDGTLVDTHAHIPFPVELEGMGSGALGHYWGGSHHGIVFEFGGGSLPPLEMLTKRVTSGPDVDGDGEIDAVVEVGQLQATSYDFTITQNGYNGTLIVDTVPAEWNVMFVESDNTEDQVDVFSAGRGNHSKGATKIHWRPASASSSLLVWVETRQSPGKKNIKFAPTSCGVLYLNEDGAAAYEVDPETGKPSKDPATGEELPPLAVTGPLCLAAVWDVDGDGVIVRDGSGDEDWDGLSDFDEACIIGTSPCNPDTDGDGVGDGVDPDPLDPLIP